MTREVHVVTIGRVVVRQAGARAVRASDVQELIQAAIIRELGSSPLPGGLTVRDSVSIPARPVAAGAPGLAAAIASGVARAVSGGRSRG